MQLRIQKRAVIIVAIIVAAIFLIALLGTPAGSSTLGAKVGTSVDGTIMVKAGYFPKEITLPAGRETVLRFQTKDTYDCSASLYIGKLNIERFLPPTGDTDITLPAQSAGSEIIAGCSMGMYSFKIKFQ